MNIEKKRLCDKIAITWACSPIYHTTNPLIGFTMALRILQKVATISDECLFYPEVGNGGSNIHFHGIIKIKDKVKWFKSVLPTLKKNGFVKITTMNEGWYEYISKDWEIMKEVLNMDAPINEEFLKRIRCINKLKKLEHSQNIVDLMYKSDDAK